MGREGKKGRKGERVRKGMMGEGGCVMVFGGWTPLSSDIAEHDIDQ